MPANKCSTKYSVTFSERRTGALPGIKDAVYGVSQVLLGSGEDREAGQHQDRHLGLEDGLEMERQIFIIKLGKSAHHSNTPHLSSATDYQRQKINRRNSVKVRLRCWRYQITINEDWAEISAH